MTKHIAVYGTVKVKRIRCQRCKCWTIIAKDGLKLCCNEKSEEEVTSFRGMIEAYQKRKPMPRKAKLRMLEKFNHSCCYCERVFGTYVNIKNKVKLIRVNWDHKIPFSYSYNNQEENYLPACSFCNAWKGNKIFQSMEGVKIYVAEKWKEARKENAV